MFGLAPRLTEDKNLLARQFLHSFITTGDQKDMGLLESFSFTGGESFMIGANGSEFTDRIGLNFGRHFNNKAFTCLLYTSPSPRDVP